MYKGKTGVRLIANLSSTRSMYKGKTGVRLIANLSSTRSMYKGKTGVRLIANLPGGIPKKETNGSSGQG